jgi:rhodanese-related sulfurtransferase
MSDAIVFFESALRFQTDSWDLRQALLAGENVVVLDVRSAEAFEEEHIPNALNLHHSQMNEETTAKFDRTALYVSYCDGIGCNGSTKGALRMTQLGFRTKELIGGIDWWKRDNHPTTKATVQLQTG